MKCNHCGAVISNFDKICPYCGNVNEQELKFRDRIQNMINRNKKLKKETIEKNGKYMANIILTRTLIVLVLFFFLSAIIGGIVLEMLKSGSSIIKPKDYKQHEEQLYNEERFGELYDYMNKYDLVSEDDYKYSQMALYYYDYEQFCIRRDEFVEKYINHEEMYTWSASYVAHNAEDLLLMCVGTVYKETDEDNRKYMEKMAAEVETFLRVWLCISDEDIQEVKDGGYLSSSKIDDWFVENYQWIRE